MSKALFTAEDHSWLVCAYRESPYLEECIQSLMNQTVKSRIQVSTATPNDHIRSIAARYGLKLIVNQGQPGIGSDWNFALENGETEWMTIAHQDDLYEPGYTEAMLRNVNRCRRLILFFSDYAELRDGKKVETNKILRIKRMLLVPIRLFPGQRWARRLSLSVGDPICCPAVTYRKSVMEGIRFSESMIVSLDWEMMERLSRLKGGFAFDPGRLMCHRIHRESATTELISDHTRTREDYEMMRKFWPEKIARKLSKAYSESEKSNSI